MPVLSGKVGRAFQYVLNLLRVLKQLKYFWNLSKRHLAILLKQLSRRIPEVMKLDADAAFIPSRIEGG